MAAVPAVSPGRRKRENVFFQPGVQGRKTGITIQDTGRRDEHGFEPLDAIFSSPEKSPPKRSARGAADALVESIELQHSPVLHAAIIVSPTRSSRTSRVSLPPPKARSPIKTHLNSSPQRHPSLAPASAARQSLGSPIRPAQMSSVKRRIDFFQDVPRKSLVFGTSKPQRGSRSSDVENRAPSEDQDVPALLPEGDSYMPMGADESMQMITQDDAQIHPAQAAIRRPDNLVPSPPDSTESLKRKRRSPIPDLKTDLPDDELPADDTVDGALPAVEGVNTDPMPSPGTGTMDVYRDVTAELSGDSADDYQEDKPFKKPRKPGRRSLGKKNALTGQSKAPKERNANARPPTRKRATSKAPSEIGDQAPSRATRGPSKPRSLQILRAGTPLDEPGAKQTRSGRQSVQPVAWWCGERINRDYDGTIKDVIRAETVDLTPKQKRPGRPRKALQDTAKEEEESSKQMEAWEKKGHILTGLVKDWDPELNMTIEDSQIEQEVAFAASGIQTKEGLGGDFSYAKLVACPFFAAGIVDLPPGGCKREKNSRLMQMAFFVHTGRVLVTVDNLEFSIGKGSAWQVPRGNWYSIENRGLGPARIFFAQAHTEQ